MRTIYIADDGTQFDNVYECEDYEFQLGHPHLKEICCYDKDGKELPNLFSQDTYTDVVVITVPSDEAAKELQELAKYTGFCFYEHVTKQGTWVFHEDQEHFHLTKVVDITEEMQKYADQYIQSISQSTNVNFCDYLKE